MEQLSIFETVAKKEQAEKVYLNGLGYPLPWEEDAYNALPEQEKQKLLDAIKKV
jgi:hypothetical protein